MRFNRAECKALHVDQGNLKQKYLLGRELIESSSKEKILGMLADVKLGVSQP